MTRFNLFDHETSSELTDWWRVFETNVRGTVSFTRAVLPGLKAQKNGSGYRGGAVKMEAAGQSEKMQGVFQQFQELQNQMVDLPANTCVALCVEKDAKAMGGRYVDSQQDIGQVLEEAKKGRVEKERLYWLKMDEI
ncbi:MAG: hypothetical protein Q9198_000598 [Flavoplaca austrocitrina]